MAVHMTHPERGATLVIAADRGRIIATFYDAAGDEMGFTPHPVDRTESDVAAHYEARGWVLAERDGGVGDGRP